MADAFNATTFFFREFIHNIRTRCLKIMEFYLSTMRKSQLKPDPKPASQSSYCMRAFDDSNRPPRPKQEPILVLYIYTETLRERLMCNM